MDKHGKFQTFYVRFDSDITMPSPIQANNPVDAAVCLMQAQPQKWYGREHLLAVEVRDRIDSKPKKMECVDVLKHFPAKKEPPKVEGVQDRLFPEVRGG